MNNILTMINKRRTYVYIYTNDRKNILYWNTIFLLIKTKFNNYNLGMNIESQSGKAPKKGKNVCGRKK